MASTYEVHGLAEVKRKLKMLPQAVRNRILRSMAGAGAKVVRDDAALRAGVKKRDILYRASRSKSAPGAYVYSVGPEANLFYLRFRELGAGPHTMNLKLPSKLRKNFTPKKVMSDGTTIYGTVVDHPGQQPKPFLRPALYENIPKVVEAMRKRGMQRIEKEAARL